MIAGECGLQTGEGTLGRVTSTVERDPACNVAGNSCRGVYYSTQTLALSPGFVDGLSYNLQRNGEEALTADRFCMEVASPSCCGVRTHPLWLSVRSRSNGRLYRRTLED
jgi:hypothetical protein